MPEMLEKVVAEAMARAGASLEAARAGEVNGVALFRLDPDRSRFRRPGLGRRRSTI